MRSREREREGQTYKQTEMLEDQVRGRDTDEGEKV